MSRRCGSRISRRTRGPIDFCYQARADGHARRPGPGGARRRPADASRSDATRPMRVYPRRRADRRRRCRARQRSQCDAVAVPDTCHEVPQCCERGPITIAVVRAGATSCANPLAAADVTLDPGSSRPSRVLGGSDDGGIAHRGRRASPTTATDPDDKTRVRVINAALGTADVAAAGAARGARGRGEDDRARRSRRTAPRIHDLGAGPRRQPRLRHRAPVPPPTSIAIGARGDERRRRRGLRSVAERAP